MKTIKTTETTKTFGKLASAAIAMVATAGVATTALGDEIRIGLIAATSGPAAFLGEAEKKAFDMRVEQLNAEGGIAGHTIVPVFFDTEGNGTKAAQQFRRLAETDNVHVVIGPSTTGESMVIKPLAAELKLPTISMGGAGVIVDPIEHYMFKTPPTDNIVAAHIMEWVKSKGMGSIALLSSADGYGQAGAGAVKAAAEAAGIEVAIADEFGARDSDMTPQLLRVRSSDAEALIVWSVNPGPTIILRNAQSIGLKQPIINSYGAASQALIDQAGGAAEGSYVSSMRILAPQSLADDDPIREVVQKLAADYNEAFGENPPTFAAHSYDALNLIKAAVEKSGVVGREEITDAINSGVEFAGGNGYFRYSADNHNGLGADSQSMIMLTVKDGGFVLAD